MYLWRAGLILFLCMGLFSGVAFSEKVQLKNGKIIEGNIIEQDDAHIKINLEGVGVTFFADEIESITLNDGSRAVFESSIKEVTVQPEIQNNSNLAVQAAPTVSKEPDAVTAPDIKEAEKIASPAASLAPSVLPEDASLQITRISETSTPGAETINVSSRRTRMTPAQQRTAAKAAGSVFLVLFILGIAVYGFIAYCLQLVADKTKTANGWWAWIPIANIFLMCDIAGRPRWWVALFLLSFIPFVGALAVLVIHAIICIDIAKRLNRPAWWGVLMVLPFLGLIAYGVLAFTQAEIIDKNITPADAPTPTA